MRHTRWLAGPALAAAVLLAAGCARTATATPTVPEIAGQVQTALRSVNSLHVSGLMVSGDSRTWVDLSLTRAGGMYGTVSAGRQRLTLLTAGSTTYLLVTVSSLRAMNLPASACPVLCNRYFQLAPRQVRAFTQGLSWSTFLGPWVGPELQQLTFGGLAHIGGQQAWVLRAANGGMAYVAASGTPYVMRILPGNGPAGGGRLDFSQWNRTVIPPTPPATEIIPPGLPGAPGTATVPGPAAN